MKRVIVISRPENRKTALPKKRKKCTCRYIALTSSDTSPIKHIPREKNWPTNIGDFCS